MGMDYGRIDEWILSEDSFDSEHTGKCEAVMSLGNGYMGLRSAAEERYSGECRDLLVNGIFDRFDESEVTELANVQEVTAIEIWINGQRFTLDKGVTKEYSRSLNIKTGELTRKVVWMAPGGESAELSFKRIVSLKRLHDITMSVSVTALSGDLKLKIRSGIDARVTNGGTQHFIEGEKRFIEKEYLQFVQTTIQSKIDVVVNAAHRFFVDGEEISLKTVPNIDRRVLYADYELELLSGSTFTLEKYANVNTGRDKEWAGASCADIQKASIEDLKASKEAGYDLLLSESAAKWMEEVWDNAPVEIEGDDASAYDLFSLRFAMYHMRVMLPRHDARMNIPAKGLSGEGYKGHCFWDTEIFLLPYYIFTDPAAARNLVKYRYLSLPGAHAKAKENGHEGAMFPWESAWLDDGETCPAYMGTDIITGTPIKVWSGIIEQHITADVAFGVWQYATASGDEEFMRKYGYELIMDAAVFWASRLEEGDDGLLHINNVVGPDEYHEHVNDNAFTNYMAKWNLDKAIEYHDFLKENDEDLFCFLSGKLALSEHYPKWTDGAGRIYLPKAGDDDILPMDDRFMSGEYIDLTKYKEQPFVAGIMKDYNLDQIQNIQVCKQADTLVLFFLLEDLFPPKVKKASWDYYIERTLHDSSLSLSTHSVLASDMGEQDLAYDLFRQAAAIDLGPYMGSSDAGIHAASFGGVWQCVVYGFGGMRMIEGKLHFRPHLPKGWDKLKFEFFWKGERLRATVTKQDILIEDLSSGSTLASLGLDALPEEGLVI